MGRGCPAGRPPATLRPQGLGFRVKVSVFGFKLSLACASTSSMMTRPRHVSERFMEQASRSCPPLEPLALLRSEPNPAK